MGWNYSVYLGTMHWKRTRLAALVRVDYHCERCRFHGTDETLNVHHKRYRLWHEQPEDLEVLCRPCHALTHTRNATNSNV